MISEQQQRQPVLMNGDEDPYKSEGRIELRIENVSGFIKEELYSERLSDPVNVCGISWRILAILDECDAQQPAEQNEQQKCLDYYLRCEAGTDPFWSYSVTAQLKILVTQQKKRDEGKVDYVHTFRQKTFSAEDSDDYGFPEYLTFEEIMDLDEGLYDEQSDSITLAVDLTVEAAEGGIGKYVLVAENELTLDRVPINFSMQIGHLQWEINFEYDNQQTKKGEKSVLIICKDVAKARADKVLLELFGYHRNRPKSELYSPIVPDLKPATAAAVHRHLFTRAHNALAIDIPEGRAFNNILFTARVFRERGLFPDFTKPSAVVGRFSADVRLRVGDRQFHVNRQLLSTHSLFFDRMFHGDYTAATQQEVELSLNTHSAELFRQFLLVLCVNEVLPNSMNVTALFKLADFYDAENVHKKCDQHLRMAREMPIEKRVLLARDHGSDETQDLIVDSASLEQSKCINRLLMRNNRSL